MHRAWQPLGITLIPAYSPEARGRAGITEMAAASRYLAEQCLPAYHPRVAGPASDAGTAFAPWIDTHLAEMLCVQDERVVPRTTPCGIRWASPQISQDPHRFDYVKVTVRVHEYPNGTVAVVHGPRCLARL